MRYTFPKPSSGSPSTPSERGHEKKSAATPEEARQLELLIERVIFEVRKELGGIRAANQLTSAELKNNELNETLSTLKKDLDRLQRIRQDLKTLHARFDKESGALSQDLQEVLESTSWMLTAPLRYIGRRTPAF